jgi:hypothetical protein
MEHGLDHHLRFSHVDALSKLCLKQCKVFLDRCTLIPLFDRLCLSRPPQPTPSYSQTWQAWQTSASYAMQQASRKGTFAIEKAQEFIYNNTSDCGASILS